MAVDRSTAVVIVNYRTANLVVDCLASLAHEVAVEPALRAIVVDNSSRDQSVATITTSIRQRGWTWAKVLPLERNGGFAFGNNAAVRLLRSSTEQPKYIWLLNPDTLVLHGAATALIDFLETHPDVGVAGGGLEFPDGRLQTAAFRFPSLLAEFEDTIRLGLISRVLRRCRVPMPPQTQAHAADWVNGASLMIRSDVFASVGEMDEGYFLYFEETDLCRRVRQAGKTIWHVPESRVVHLEGQSTGVTGANLAQKRRPAYWFDSRARYYRKQHGFTYALLADLIFITCFGLWRVQRRLRRKEDQDPPGLWWDFVRHAFRRWLKPEAPARNVR